MKSKYALIFLFVFVNFHCLSLRRDPGARIVGNWVGLADGQNEFSMTFSREEGDFTGFVNIPVNGMFNMPLIELTLEDDNINGSFDLGGGVLLYFTGVFQEDGSVTGSYDMADGYGTFEMGRAED